MSFIVVIPARYESSRLPGKPLLDIAGKPMLQHVIERAQQSSAKAVYVATDDNRIQDMCITLGVNVCMTSTEHTTGTDRIEEVTRKLHIADNEIVVNVQGDEPLIPPAVIDQVAANLAQQSSADICTLYEDIHSLDEINDPNAVKLVTDKDGLVLYFSRAPIPFHRDKASEASIALNKRHVGIYAYRTRVLHQFVGWPVCELEKMEKLEQLRAMYQGVRIHAQASCETIPAGIDTEADLEKVRQFLQNTNG